MLPSNKMKLVEDVLTSFTNEELYWLNGFISGKLSGSATPVAQTGTTPAAAPKPQGKVTIAYGTETGNSKKLAANFAAKAKQHGFNAKLVSFDQYRLNDLSKEEYLLSVISTQGEGEPPAAAKKFYEHIHNNGFKLDKLKYGVLALGDTSYPLFCKAGEDVDQQLSRLGGERIVPLQRCDVDYETEAELWFQQVLNKIGNVDAQPAISVTVPRKTTGRQIHRGAVLTNVNLNDRGSNKQTHHIEISAEGVAYQPGDALGLVPPNPAAVTKQVLELLELNENDKFSYKGTDQTAIELLSAKLSITYLPERVVAKYASLVQQDIPATKIPLPDLLRIYPLKDRAQLPALIEILEPITPRLYSISSSPEAHPDEIHLTVARDRFLFNDEELCGLCSDFLVSLEEGAEFDFYIHHNNNFRLPASENDVIMIGPGTGIAPFRSFLAERDATGASGRNWLFFGDQHFVTDFLYQTELQNWVDTGVLTKLNVAFSRDQEQKIYVQHKMLQHGEQLFQWLTNGASLYVCGAREPMSIDVENTLLQIIATHGKQSPEAAKDFLAVLKDEGRYLKDVY